MDFPETISIRGHARYLASCSQPTPTLPDEKSHGKDDDDITAKLYHCEPRSVEEPESQTRSMAILRIHQLNASIPAADQPRGRRTCSASSIKPAATRIFRHDEKGWLEGNPARPDTVGAERRRGGSVMPISDPPLFAQPQAPTP